METIKQFILGIPKLLLGTIIIVLCLTFLIYSDPPTTICDIQMQAVNEKLVGRFYSNKQQGRVNAEGFVVGGSRTGSYQKGVLTAFDFCMKSNSPGGCFDMFSRLNYFEKQLRTVPGECGHHVSTKIIKGALEKGIKLIVKIAWGEKPPESNYEKTAWLDTSDIALFCRLKAQHKRIFGAQAWKVFREALMLSLPERKLLKRKQVWEKSLLSYSCRRLL